MRISCLFFLSFTSTVFSSFFPSAIAQSGVLREIPYVQFAIIRLDYLTYAIKGYYLLTQPYRKSLLPDGFVQAGNVFHKQVPAADYGYTRVQSRLTGQLLIHTTTVWAGGGHIQYPPDSLFINQFNHGFVNSNPDTLIYVPFFETTRQRADSAWDQVKDTDIIHRISTMGRYEVFVFDHYYSIGMGDPYTAEWFIVAYTRPRAPLDAGFTDLLWPKTLMTTNVSNTPQMTVYNFSDSTINVAATLTVLRGLEPIYSSRRVITSFRADSSCLTSFDTLRVSTLRPLTLTLALQNPDGSPWVDAFSDNDTWQQQIGMTTLPVFRPISSIKYPGRVPVRGVAFDLDGDRDIDVFEYNTRPKLWQNDGHGNYTDITNLSNITLRMHPRLAIESNLNGDQHPDILVIYAGTPPQFLVGDGTGIFEDKTAESGLSQINGYYDVEAFDKENDGDNDLLFQSTGQEILMQNNGSGHFTDVTQVSGIVDPSQTLGVSAGDLNNDGYKDVVLTNWGAVSKVFVNNGGGRFTLLNGPWNSIYGRMSIVFDYDGDRTNDILFCIGHFLDRTLLYKGMGNLTFQEVSLQTGLNLPAFRADVADVNRDGRQDMIADYLDRFNLLTYTGNSYVDTTGLLVDMRTHMQLGALGGSPAAQFIDLDGDGDLDIYSQMVVFENMGIDSTRIAITPTPAQVPASYGLHQNYPNPFNSATKIRILIPPVEKPHVLSLRVYDMLGREVTTLVNQRLQPGNHEVIFDGSGLASGVYFYRLLAGDFLETKKFILLR